MISSGGIAFGSDAITAVTDMAKAVGIPGAFLLLIALAIAFHIRHCMDTVRGMAKDFYDWRLKSKALEIRIVRESERLETDARRKLPNALAKKGSEQ